MTTIKDLVTPLEEKEESILKESCISNEEQLFEHEIEEGKKENESKMNENENHAYEILIE